MERVMHFDVPVPDEIADKVDNMSEDDKAKFLAGCAYAFGKITQWLLGIVEYDPTAGSDREVEA